MKQLNYIILLGSLAIYGCSSDSSPASDDAAFDIAKDSIHKVEPSCQLIGEGCHFYDKGDAGNPVAHDCHVLGHKDGATEAECAAKVADCAAVCPGLLGDAGPDVGKDSAPDATDAADTADASPTDATGATDASDGD